MMIPITATTMRRAAISIWESNPTTAARKLTSTV